MSDYLTSKARGDAAAAVLDNPIFQESFDTLKQALIDAWMKSPVNDDPLKRENLHKMVVLVDKIRALLTDHLNSGKIAELALEHLADIERFETLRHQRRNT